MPRRHSRGRVQIRRTKSCNVDLFDLETNKSYRALLKKLPIYARGCHSKTGKYQLLCVENIRRLLAFSPKNHPLKPIINVVIKTGVVPQLIRILRLNTNRALQYESLWALTNIAAGDTKHTQLLIKNNIIYSLKTIIRSNITNNDTKSQAIWCLSNIAGDGANIRNSLILKHNIYYECIAPLFKSKTNIIKDRYWLDLMRNSSWALCNLCRNPSETVFTPAIKKCFIALFRRTLCIHSDPETLSNIYWAIDYFIDTAPYEPGNTLCKSKIDEIFNAFGDIVIKRKMIDMLKTCTDTGIQCKVGDVVIRIIGDIVFVDDYDKNNNAWIHKLIEFKIFKRYDKILRSKNEKQQLLALWTMSNIAVDFNRDGVITDVFSKRKVIVCVYKLLNYASFSVRKEAAWVIFNIVSECVYIRQVEAVIKLSLIIPALLCLFRYSTDSAFTDRFGLALMETIEKLLSLGSEGKNYKTIYWMVKHSAIDALETFKDHFDDIKDKDITIKSTDDSNYKERKGISKSTQKPEEYHVCLKKKIDDVLCTLQIQQKDEIYLVKCCALKCNKTKYVTSYDTRSVASATSDECQTTSDEHHSSTSSSLEIVKMHRFYRCRGCRVSVYCSHRCQKWHWKNGHKTMCGLFVM